MRFVAIASAAGLLFGVARAPAQVQPESAPMIRGAPAGPPAAPTWRLIFSPYTLHFDHDPAHRPVVLLGLEREHPNGVVWGGAVFDNSFGQPSAYAFGGQRLYGWSRWRPLYAEWSAGLLYGYTGEYAHKVPLNYKGFSPGIVAGIGWQFNEKVEFGIDLLGNSGLMFHVSTTLP